MPFQVSPGVNFSEYDLTTVIPAVSTSVAGIAMPAKWGTVGEIVTITDEDELKDTFGEPNSNNATQWISAANFLQYANHLKVVRAEATGAKNATSNNNANYSATGFTSAAQANNVTIKTRRDYDDGTGEVDGTGSAGTFLAKWPGRMGNSLKVIVWDSAVAFTNTAPYGSGIQAGQGLTSQANNFFDGSPGTSTWAAQWGSALYDELHVMVLDEDGEFTGTKNTILEKYAHLSKSKQSVAENGDANYWKDVINDRSPYIWVNTGQLYQDGITLANTNAGTLAPHATRALGVANVGVYSVGDNSKAGQDPRKTDTFGLHARDLAANGSTFEIHTSPLQYSFGGGVDASTAEGRTTHVTAAQMQTAYDEFLDSETVDISMLIAGDSEEATSKYIIQNIAEKRKDTIAFISPDKDDVVNKSTDAAVASALVGTTGARFGDDSLNISSSYAAMDSGWKYQYDKYNEVYRWIPLNADIAGLCARTDYQRDAWWSPAGFNRGQIKNVTKLAWNPKQAHRDDLYRAGINPVVTLPGQGTILYGDKTLQSKPSAFDRINVRRLFIVLEKAISTAAKFSLFEFNDEFTRAQFRNMVEPFLRDVQGRRGITDFRVICDETNNTSGVIDRNEFVGDIYVKPARSINYIQLNFVAVRTGVDFSEIVGQF
jgi:phage tail sheath protein FI